MGAACESNNCCGDSHNIDTTGIDGTTEQFVSNNSILDHHSSSAFF